MWIALARCAGDRPAPVPPPERPSAALEGGARPVEIAARVRCERAPFAETLAVPEASGAAYVAAAGPPFLLVVGDSGNRGELVEVDPDSGRVLARGRLDLDGEASDDLEGLAVRDRAVYAVTSSGWLRHWRFRGECRAGAGDSPACPRYRLAVPAYPINGDRATGCRSAHDSNCGHDYEGLCLADPAPAAGRCAGFAVAKADGALHCLVERGGRMRVDPARTLRVLPPGVATGCHFDRSGALWLGTNWFGSNRVYRIENPGGGPAATIEAVGALGSGFSEALAVAPGGAVFRFSDSASRVSGVDKYLCR